MVIGVGNGGLNAVNRMAKAHLRGVELTVIDTDAQVLKISKAHRVLQIGEELTRGRSTGGRLELGRNAAEQGRDKLADLLKGLDMVFIAAGMGGGTGTGASPIIAELAKGSGALTIGIVTKPFSFEGNIRAEKALRGLEDLKRKVDVLIAIPNDKLLEVVPGTPITQAFELADDVLRQGVQGITDLITAPGMINLNLADVESVLKDAGTAMIGIGEGKGERKTREAIERAIKSPLLERGSIRGAARAIINITGGSDLSLGEVTEAASLVQNFTSEEADITFGAVIKEGMENMTRITVIATGFREEVEEEVEKEREEGIDLKDLDIPTFMRRRKKAEGE